MANNEQRYYDALKAIARNYDSSEKIKRNAERRYGLSGEEALEMAYDNIQQDARVAIAGRRRPRIQKGPGNGE